MSIGDGNDAEGNGAGGDAPLHQTKKQRTIADGGPINHEWTPPEKVEELFAKAGGNRFASINQPTSGARAEVPLPDTDRPVQLYSLGTPNGIKVGILLEELGVDYDAHKINIMKCEQFNSGFVNVNPNSKIPAAIDKDGPGGEPIHLFESAAIMTYFADKMDRFNFSANARARQEMMQWITFQMANQGPTTGNFGHFFVYAPEDKCETREYGVARYGMEVQRICDVMDKHLEGRAYFVNEEYSVADMALFPWFDQLRKGYVHKSGIAAATFLSVDKYKNLNRWADELLGREAVQRGITVCSWEHENTKPWLKSEL
jgi:GST-like protein